MRRLARARMAWRSSQVPSAMPLRRSPACGCAHCRSRRDWYAAPPARRDSSLVLVYSPSQRTRTRRQHFREAPMAAFTVNGQRKEVSVDGNTPLLWVLREHLKLTGTKFGCGIASCGACTVHIDGKAVRSCAMPVSLVEGKSVTTIEGLSPDGSHPLQKAWIAEQVPQCGYCQSGQIMQAAELLVANKYPTREQIVAHMDGNICRCGTYLRIISAIQRAAKEG